MTQDEWNDLPMLIRPGDAARVLGVDMRTLQAIGRENDELCVRVPGLKEIRYRKRELAKLLDLSDRYASRSGTALL